MKVKNRRGDEAEAKVKKCSIRKASVLCFSLELMPLSSLKRSERWQASELNVDNWNDNCEAKNEAKSPRPLRGLQVDSSFTRNVPYAVR